jgi:hypothetical protein
VPHFQFANLFFSIDPDLKLTSGSKKNVHILHT